MQKALVLLFSILATSNVFAAAACGVEPDPLKSSADYDTWCSCMGGKFERDTTTCSGAHVGTTATSQAESWFCIARSSNGGCGYSVNVPTQKEARTQAVIKCRENTGGEACAVIACNTSRPLNNPCTNNEF